MAETVGTLAPGTAADVSVFRLAEGEWTFRDSSLAEETGSMRLEPVAVIRAGRVTACTPAAY
jgi:predicted amidohydrolase